MRTLLTFFLLAAGRARALEPTWESLDNRTLPGWYQDAKFGIFLHWGIFSVPSFGSEWFWQYWKSGNSEYEAFINKTERPVFSYTEYASRFTALLYDPDQWADIFAKAGAQYVVLTSKHHEGYCMWNSTSIPTTWNWNAMEVGPQRDVLGELSRAVQATKSSLTGETIQFGVYHSLYEWFNPLYLSDRRNNFTTSRFVDEKTMPELYDLVRRYRPTLIWSDGEGKAPSSYWKATKFLQWYATESPVADKAVWNDRWGTDTLCKHGGFITCRDRYNPGILLPKKWENAFTIDRTSWGLNRNASFSDYLTVKDLVHLMIQVVAFNGNFLLNAGPAADGTIHPIFVDRLLGIGKCIRNKCNASFLSAEYYIEFVSHQPSF
jgi:alpha-L-fucosidase